MGFYYVNAVLRGLKGTSYGSGIKHTKEAFDLNASDMMLLLTVAYRQPNPGEYLGVYDTVCLGDIKTMCNLTHIERTTLDQKRKKLVKLELLDYKRHDWCQDPKNHGKMKQYDNVYRINLATIRKLYPDENEWMDILCFKCEKSNDSRLLSALCIGNEGANDVQNPNMDVQNPNMDVQNPNMDVQNPNTNKNKQHQNENPQYCRGDDLEERIVELINSKYNVADSKSLRNKIKEAIAGKCVDSVNKFLDDESKWSWATTYKGLLLAIKNVPNTKDDSAYKQKNNAYVIAKNYPTIQLRKIGERLARHWLDMSGEMIKKILDKINELIIDPSKENREKISNKIAMVVSEENLETPEILYNKLVEIGNGK